MQTSPTAQQLLEWHESGCAALTGRPDGPPMDPPPNLADWLDRMRVRLTNASRSLGHELAVDPYAELALRHRTHGLTRRGRTSCGGATRLLRCADGWVAISLARESDLELVPAIIERPVIDAWTALDLWCGARSAAEVEARCTLLGVPAGRCGATPSTPLRMSTGAGPPSTRSAPLVVDLSSLWAGPLCGALLSDVGCEVVKVEAITRPDGTRSGPPDFFERMNANKSSVTFDPRTTSGRDELLALVEQADVVIEASRPRALAQLGVDRRRLVRGPAVWMRITGHGSDGDSAERVGFGDDTAVSGGLIVHDHDGPLFCADAIGDPMTGMLAAAVVMELLATRAPGTRTEADVSMSAVAANCVEGLDP